MKRGGWSPWIRAAVLGGLTFDIGPQGFLMPADPSENQREVEGKEGDPHLCTCDNLFKMAVAMKIIGRIFRFMKQVHVTRLALALLVIKSMA